MPESKIYLISISLFSQDDTDFYAYPFTDKKLAREAFEKLIARGYNQDLNKERTHAYSDLSYEVSIEEVTANSLGDC